MSCNCPGDPRPGHSVDSAAAAGSLGCLRSLEEKQRQIAELGDRIVKLRQKAKHLDGRKRRFSKSFKVSGPLQAVAVAPGSSGESCQRSIALERLDHSWGRGLSHGVMMPVVGYVCESSFLSPFEAPRQPGIAHAKQARMAAWVIPQVARQLLPLVDSGNPYVFVLFQFDRNVSWRLRVFPPAGTRRYGLFATRTPHRPNPIGQSLVRLTSVIINDGLCDVEFAEGDLLLGTPIIGFRPAFQDNEVHPEASAGFRDNQALPLSTEVDLLGAASPVSARFKLSFASDEVRARVVDASNVYPGSPPLNTLAAKLGLNPLLMHRHRLTSRPVNENGLCFISVGLFTASFRVIDEEGNPVRTAEEAARSSGAVEIVSFEPSTTRHWTKRMEDWIKRHPWPTPGPMEGGLIDSQGACSGG